MGKSEKLRLISNAVVKHGNLAKDKEGRKIYLIPKNIFIDVMQKTGFNNLGELYFFVASNPRALLHLGIDTDLGFIRYNNIPVKWETNSGIEYA